MGLEETQTPDMTAAGMPPPSEPMSQAGLVDALRSRGTLPSGLASMLAPPVGANAGLAAASGLLNAQAGIHRWGNASHTPNPYMQQQFQQQQLQAQQNRTMLNQQAAMWELQQREQARKARQDEMGFKMSETLLKSPSKEARLTGAKGMVGYMRKMGMDAPDSVIGALATQRLSDADVNAMYRDIHLGMDDQALLVKYSNATPQDVQQMRRSKDSPIVLAALGLKTPQEHLKTTYDLRIAAAKALEAAHPELRGAPGDVGGIQMRHRELFGTDYMEGDKDTQARAYKSFMDEKHLREEKLIRLKSELDLAKILTGLQFKADHPSAAPAGKPVPIQIKQKMLAPFSAAQGVVKGIDLVEDAVKEMEALGALPAGEDVASQYAAKLKRSTLLRGNPAVVKFEQLWGPVSIGQIDRGLFDEKGVRAISAFSKQLNAVDNIPPAHAIRAYLNVVRKEVFRKMEDDIQNMEGLDGMPPDVIEQAKRMYLNTSGKGEPARGPLNPEKDPLGILGQ